MCIYTFRSLLRTLSALVLASSLPGCGATADESPGRPAPLVSTRSVSLVSGYEQQRTFVGEVVAARRTGAGFELGGMVEKVHVREGDQVEAGALLAELNTDRLRARRVELSEAISSARANAMLAESTYRRIETAQQQRGASVQDLDEARHALEARQAELRRARAAIDTIDVDLAKSELRAPFRSIVTARLADEGQVVQAGTPLIELIEQNAPEIRIGLGGGAPIALGEGDRHIVRIGRRQYDVVVRAVLPVRNADNRTVDAILQLDEALDGTVRNGDVASLQLSATIDEPGFWLPLQALTESARGLWAVYVAEPLEEPETSQATHVVSRRELEVLHQRADQVFARGTLEDGANIVTAGIHRLTPGLQVRVAASVDETAAAL